MDLTTEAMKAGGIPDGYDEVQVTFFQFKNEGDTIEGRLISKNVTTIRGNKIGKYVIMKPDTERITFLGGVHLDELMANVGVGNEIKILYTHQEKTEEGYPMKRFKVFIHR